MGFIRLTGYIGYFGHMAYRAYGASGTRLSEFGLKLGELTLNPKP